MFLVRYHVIRKHQSELRKLEMIADSFWFSWYTCVTLISDAYGHNLKFFPNLKVTIKYGQLEW